MNRNALAFFSIISPSIPREMWTITEESHPHLLYKYIVFKTGNDVVARVRVYTEGYDNAKERFNLLILDVYKNSGHFPESY